MLKTSKFQFYMFNLLLNHLLSSAKSSKNIKDEFVKFYSHEKIKGQLKK